MKAEIITIGDELLIGQVINTNQAYLAEQFNLLGIFVEKMTTVGDAPTDILQAFHSSWNNFDLICVTGGLGPTHDDITKKSICQFFNKELVEDKDVLKNIEELLSNRNLKLSNVAIEQAKIPKDFTSLKNRLGTAPGLLYQINHNGKNKYFLSLPGVPYEMKSIIENEFIPFFKNQKVDEFILHRTIRTTGIIEAHLSDKIGDISKLLGTDDTAKLAFLPSPRGTRLRITIRSNNETFAKNKLLEIENEIYSKVNNYIYSNSDIEIEEVVGKILREKKLTIAIAESCTGGFISNRITNISGSSDYFLQSYITYSNQSKINLLNVSKSNLEQFGSVSKEVAIQMAIGAKNNSGADIAISITGIAGPTGGTIEKPIGSSWIALSDSENVISKFNNFGTERLLFKERASQSVLELLRRNLLGLPI